MLPIWRVSPITKGLAGFSYDAIGQFTVDHVLPTSLSFLPHFSFSLTFNTLELCLPIKLTS